MGIEADIWSALKNRVAALNVVPAAQVAWPNVSFTKPSGQWVRVSLVPNRSRRLLIASNGPHQKQGILQVDCYVSLNSGTNAAVAMAEAVAAHFPCDLGINHGSASVRVTKAPDVGPALPNDTHWQVPVTIEYETFG